MGEIFRNTLGPAAWTAVALVPPAIFLLYFLKLKRQPLEVPSTYLWTKVVEDLHVNSIWQKLRRNLLLFLQLLLVGLAILALLRPGWQGQTLEGQRFIFLVDNSASMSTEDVDGQTRLEAAKQRVSDLIDQLENDMAAMIISFSDQPDVVQEFTNNQRLLHDALDRIQPTAKRTSIRGALELADGFANPEKVMIEEGGTEFEASTAEPVELFILSDGRFGPVEGFSLGNLRPQYLPIGDDATNNLAVTTLTTRRNENLPEIRQAFVQVANFSDEDRETIVELYLNGELVEAAQIEAPAGEATGVTFNLGDVPTGTLEAHVDPQGEMADRLDIDDRAYAVLDELRDHRVLLVSPGNTALEFALSTERAQRLAIVEMIPPEDMKKPEFQTQMQTEAYDLVIFDRCTPKTIPQCSTLFIGRLPPLEGWLAESSTEKVSLPQIIDWERAHPLLSLVEMGNVRLLDSLIVKPPPGGSVLMDSTKGPLLAIAPRDNYEDAVLGFEIVGDEDDGGVLYNTDWPKHRSFPNFCLNAIEYLAGAVVDFDQQTTKPGEAVEIAVRDRATEMTVEFPDGETRTFDPPAEGSLVFHETDQLGVYDATAGSRLTARFAVNLFDLEESDVRLRTELDETTGVRTVDSLSIGFVDVEAASTSSPVRKELWKWLLLAALAVLVLEWYIYNRRVYV